MSNPADSWELPDADPEAPPSKAPPSPDRKAPADDGHEVTGHKTETKADGTSVLVLLP